MVIPGLQSSDARLRILDPEARGGHQTSSSKPASWERPYTHRFPRPPWAGRSLPVAQTLPLLSGSTRDHSSQNATRGLSAFLSPGFH